MKPEEIKRHKLSQADDPAQARDQRSKNPEENPEENHSPQVNATNK